MAYMISNDVKISENLIQSSENANKLKTWSLEDIEISKSSNIKENVPLYHMKDNTNIIYVIK